MPQMVSEIVLSLCIIIYGDLFLLESGGINVRHKTLQSAPENDFISMGGAFGTTNAILCNQIDFNS